MNIQKLPTLSGWHAKNLRFLSTSIFERLDDFKKVYVLDTVHGGKELKKKIKELGIGCEGINVYKEKRALKFSNEDMIIAPVHLSPRNLFLREALKKDCKIFSHHRAVRDIFNFKNFLRDSIKIETTGTIGKTSTAVILASILKGDGKSVLLHSSSGTYYIDERWRKTGGYSITSANILFVAEKALKDGFMPDFAIFETSLGFAGVGDVNILTSLKEDYMIASNTRWASEAKLNSIKNLKSDSLFFAPSGCSNTENRIPLSLNTFGEKGDNLYLQRPPWHQRDSVASGENSKRIIIYDDLKTIEGEKIRGKFDFYLEDGFLADFYRYPISSSVAAALSLGVEEYKIKEFLDGFSGVESRMKFKIEKGIEILDNSNSGTRLNHLEGVLKLARVEKMCGRIFLILGEESKYVCDGFSSSDPREVLSRCDRYFDELIYVEDHPESKKRCFDRYQRSKISERSLKSKSFEHMKKKTLEDAMEYTLSRAKKGDLIVSFVKTWR